MSVTRMVHVNCDVCQADYPADHQTLTQARYWSREDHWHVSKGYDICPECWDEGER